MNRKGFFAFLISMSRWRSSRILGILLVLVIFLTTALIVHGILERTSELSSKGNLLDYDFNGEKDEALRRILSGGTSDDENLKRRIEELLRIKHSVQKELRSLEEKRGQMQTQIAALLRKLEELRSQADKERVELQRLRVSVNQAKLAQTEFIERNTPEIRAPLSLKANFRNNFRYEMDDDPSLCTFSSCFDYSRCSLTSGFPVYFYENKIPIERDYSVPDPDSACLFVVTYPRGNLQHLSHWNGDGRNHLIINYNGSLPKKSRAMIASGQFQGKMKFRRGFDLVLPPTLGKRIQRNLVPVRRKYLVAYFPGRNEDRIFVKYLNDITKDNTDDEAYLCSTEDECFYVDTTFVIVDNPLGLSHALFGGSIPVIVDRSSFPLPFEEVIDWNLAAVFLPRARIPELHFLLRTYPESDLFALKRQGQLIYRHYFTDPVTTVLNVLRERLGLPASLYQDEPSPSVFNKTFKRLIMDSLPVDLMEPNESLGPLEAPNPSTTFRRNFSSTTRDRHFRWNAVFDSFKLAPYTPWEHVLPTESKFLGGSGGGFRPIGDGQGGTGWEFSQSLGGNHPGEQFTIVMLTYEREQVLINSLSRLYGLPYLNKVVVVWNSPVPPPEDLRWPDLGGIPIEVVKTKKNSLNNRFLPYSVIETEAVLSIDDDAHLRHDEIIFGFRVWRENRDRLVGFPGRFHAWDRDHDSWNYNSNYSCELSMVLTGAAFYHKYYSYVYSYEMPSVIRDKVDEFMNCEDLAMNFLISHMTRQPPVKVTSRWTFRCPGCPVTLSEDDSHFQERHKCINFFKDVYGYMPLLYTQYRADSVLFKTRIPQDKQKCFKFI